jgi:hypothetical protein
MGRRNEALENFRKGRALVAPLASRSQNKLWQTYLADFDSEMAALTAKSRN